METVRWYAGHGRSVDFGSLLLSSSSHSHRGSRFGQIIAQSTLQAAFLTTKAWVLFQAAPGVVHQARRQYGGAWQVRA
jgi:hypothetical protein